MTSSTAGWYNGTDQFGQEIVWNPKNSFGFISHNRGIANPFVSEGESYHSILALSARQILASTVITEKRTNSSEAMIFQKEISSNGKVNTIDVIHPAMPVYLYANLRLLEGFQDPVFQHRGSGLCRPYGEWAMYDIGRLYPNAIGYNDATIEQDKEMPVEDCANMIIMAFAYHKFTHDTSYLPSYYPIPQQWVEYPISHSLFTNNTERTTDMSLRLSLLPFKLIRDRRL
jgi:hypothetical protein